MNKQKFKISIFLMRWMIRVSKEAKASAYLCRHSGHQDDITVMSYFDWDVLEADEQPQDIVGTFNPEDGFKLIHVGLYEWEMDPVQVRAMTDHDRLKALKKGLMLNNGGLSQITGNSEDSIKSVTQPGLPLPRWIHLSIYIYERMAHNALNQ